MGKPVSGSPDPRDVAAAAHVKRAAQEIASLLGVDDGDQTLELVLSEGILMRTRTHAGPWKDGELVEVVRRARLVRSGR